MPRWHAVFDQHTGLLYVSLRQTFNVWLIPLYKAPVKLVSVLQLTQRAASESDWTVSTSTLTNGVGDRRTAVLAGSGQERPRYYIASQEDLYQVNDCLQFLLPGLGPAMWFCWQLYSGALCVASSLVFLPLYLLLNRRETSRKSKTA